MDGVYSGGNFKLIIHSLLAAKIASYCVSDLRIFLFITWTFSVGLR